MKYEDKQDRFNFEAAFSFENLRTWWVEAINLFYSAEVLYEFESLKTKDVFEKEKNKELAALFSPNIVNLAFFNYRVQRMLFAYGFENLLKLLILANIKTKNPNIKSVPLGKIKSHSLITLASIAEFDLSEPETFYFGVWEKCAVWAGRYPLPMKSEQIYTAREALPSREALIERSKEMWEKYINGQIPRMFAESDILHSGLSAEEYEIYKQIKNRLLEEVKNYI